MNSITNMIAEGKGKRLYATENPDEAVVYYRDETFAFHGLKRGRIIGKGEINNLICEYMFTLLTQKGVPNHFIRRIDNRCSLIKRVEISSTASGSSVTQTRVEETWLSTAPNPYARARTKMTQDINGVQTHYEYAAATQYNALYSVTSETRVAGATVPGQSRRTVEYISAEGNTLRHEEYILLPDGETWAQLSSVTNTYDVKNRLVGTLRSNGRSTTRTLTCTGDVLTETDENGLTTSYGYDTARQLVEIIRSEVCDGETVISPETITTYTRDAAGRILSERTDTGAMVTVRTTQYDLLGRITSRTDELGRTATTTYSADGLTTTVTTPAGATLITTRHADGQPLSLSGTGQRALNYSYDVTEGRLRQTVKLANNAILSQTLTNGFGETIVETQASTNGYIYTRSQYNAKGQLIKQYQDTGTTASAMAATVYEYDKAPDGRKGD